MKTRLLSSVLVVVATACGNADEFDLPAHGWEEAPPVPDGYVTSELSAAVAGPWVIPAATLAVGDAQDVAYVGAGPWRGSSGCSGGLMPGALDFRQDLYDRFAQTYHIGGYACRAINGSSSTMSLHATGRALDIFIPTTGRSADNGLGDPLGNWLIENAEHIGIQYIIWDRWTWRASRGDGAKGRSYGGRHPHHDHLHVELSPDAGARRTPWFTMGPPPPPTSGQPPCAGSSCDTVAFVREDAAYFVYPSVDAATQPTSFYFGDAGDEFLWGDWNCDDVSSPGVYRRSTGQVYLRNTPNGGVADLEFVFGDAGDIPLVGDFDGSGCDTVSIYRPSEGRVFIKNSLAGGAADLDYWFGNPQDRPFTGDFDADGIDTVGLHRERTGLVYLRNSHTSGIADAEFVYGDPGDHIVAGDWNGDGRDTVGVLRPSNGTFYVRLSNSTGVADYQWQVDTEFTTALVVR